jgi:hypothetical protein
MRPWLHLLGSSPIPGIIAVLLAAVLLMSSELRTQRYLTSTSLLDKRLYRVAIAVGVVATLAMVLRFAAVALGTS